MESRLSSGVSRIAWESPHRALLAIAQQLQSEGVPLSELFGEMILASSCVDGTDPPAPAVVELLSEPMTAAESVGTLMLAKTAARARDAQLDDEALLRVMAFASVLVARFETYLAERDARDRT